MNDDRPDDAVDAAAAARVDAGRDLRRVAHDHAPQPEGVERLRRLAAAALRGLGARRVRVGARPDGRALRRAERRRQRPRARSHAAASAFKAARSSRAGASAAGARLFCFASRLRRAAAPTVSATTWSPPWQ